MSATTDPSNPEWDSPRDKQGNKITETQKQVSQVVEIMQDNVRQVVDRGVALDDLTDRADSLSANANQFQTQSNAIRKKMWWKNLKWTLIAGGVIVIVIIIIIVVSTTGGGSDDGGNTDDDSSANDSNSIQNGNNPNPAG